MYHTSIHKHEITLGERAQYKGNDQWISWHCLYIKGSHLTKLQYCMSNLHICDLSLYTYTSEVKKYACVANNIRQELDYFSKRTI